MYPDNGDDITQPAKTDGSDTFPLLNLIVNCYNILVRHTLEIIGNVPHEAVIYERIKIECHSGVSIHDELLS